MIGILELATIFALWLYMLGAISTSRNKEHLTVDLIETFLTNPRARAFYEVTRSVIVLLITLFMLSLAYHMLGWSLKRPQTTPALSLPLLWQQAPMLAASVFFVAYAVRDILRALAGLNKTQETAEG
ncbi:hypothetical protein IMCC3135_27145 [Granulosicoccus antarcticus IMCC3135]|uniref:TRAP transporter small permease protein n=2 Tax=Granulosicoccus TaxID=437504 RepID=A0A2Z2P6J9_9GAMM|nr:hypothetical protein IMCC3135_27145 [Granulosicoccus antarcticus IMCC3135]